MRKFKIKKIGNIVVLAKTEEEISAVLRAVHFVEKRKKKPFLERFLNAILVYPKKSGYDNLCFPKEKIYVCQTKTVMEASTAYFASLLIHEARHIYQFKTKKPYYGDKAEEDAYKTQRNFLKKYGTREEVEWLDFVFKEKWWVFKDKRKRSLVHPRDKIFHKFVEKYLAGKLI